MRLEIDNNEIIEIINTIKKSQKELNDLREYALKRWGLCFWLSEDFQSSEHAYFMETISASIHYDTYTYGLLIHLN
jgi:hypothetical protein